MSNEFSISAVTITLRNLQEGVKELAEPEIANTLPADLTLNAEIVVNNLPLDEAYDFDNDSNKNQVNLFLYHVEHNPAWRNMPVPGSVKNGESGHPPLGLNLYYIITAYGENKNEIISHLLLGKAMSVLHDHPVLSRAELQNAFPGSHLHEQVERIRITPQPISVDDISKLWTGFQTQYKLSVAYEVSVILIETKRPTRTPLPVLSRGVGDRGVLVQPFVIPPYPTIESVVYPNTQPALQPGDELTLKGHHLKGSTVSFIFKHMVSGVETTRPATGSPDASSAKFLMPANEASVWSPGIYSVKLLVQSPGEDDKLSNEIGFLLSPLITGILISPLSPTEPNNYLASITFNPEILSRQQALLMIGDKQFRSRAHDTATNVLEFEMRNMAPGDYYIRLRIDGADSLLVDYSVTPPVFKAAYKTHLA